MKDWQLIVYFIGVSIFGALTSFLLGDGMVQLIIGAGAFMVFFLMLILNVVKEKETVLKKMGLLLFYAIIMVVAYVLIFSLSFNYYCSWNSCPWM